MSTPLRLTVDPIRCDAYGHCVELLPELIEFDQWGYPIISKESVPEHLQADARKAVAACPASRCGSSGTLLPGGSLRAGARRARALPT